MATYQVQGVVTELGVAVSRRLRAYKADKTSFNTLGELVGSAVSAANGQYTLPTGTWDGPTFVIAIDDEIVPNYDPGAIDWVIPELAPAPTFYYSRVLFDQPQAFWQLDDIAPTTVALDASSAGLNGTYQGSPTLEDPDTPYSNSGNSVLFSGPTQAMVSPSVLSPIAGADFTLEFPFRTASPAQQVIFASRAFTYPGANYGVLTLNLQNTAPASGHITLELADGATIDRFYTTASVAIGDDRWHHIVVIKQGATVQFIYDGRVLATTGSLTLTGPTHNGASHVFACAPDSASGLAGRLFAIPLWFAALTCEQAKVHFYLLRRPAQPYTDRILTDLADRFYGLEDDAAETVALDLAGFDAHGAYVGGATPGSDALCWEEPMATSMLVNGIGQRAEITLPFSAAEPTTAFTIECWFKTTRTQRAYILDRQGTSNRLAIVLNEGAGGAQVADVIQCFISPAPGLVYRVYTDPIPGLTSGDPHCLGVIYDHPDITFVLDGIVLAATGTITVASVIHVDGEVEYLGASAALDAATGFVGNLSHFSVWTQALPTATVQGHFQAQMPTYAEIVLQDSPEAYWKLDEASGNIDDTMGNYSNLPVSGSGAAYGQPSLLPQDPGNTCIDFNGTAYVSVFNGPVIWNRADWTMEAWFVVDDFQTFWSAVMAQGNGGPNISMFIENGNIRCGLFNGSFWYWFVLAAEVGRTYHIVFSKGAGGMAAYVNGSLYASTTATDNADWRAQFMIGYGSLGGQGPFGGRIQHVACYYTTLTQARAIKHYQVGFQGALFEDVMSDNPDRLWILGDQLNAIQAVEHTSSAAHGDYLNGATSGGPSLQPGEAYQISGTFNAADNSRVQVPAVFSSTVATTAYTLEFWFQTTKTGVSYLWDRSPGAGTTQRIAVALNASAGAASAGKIEVLHRTEASANMYVTTTGTFAQIYDGTPHHLVVTFADPTIAIYLDGAPLAVSGPMSASGLLHREDLPNFIAVRSDLLQAEKFVGNVSFVGAWDGYTLPPARVGSHYSVGSTL